LFDGFGKEEISMRLVLKKIGNKLIIINAEYMSIKQENVKKFAVIECWFKIDTK
jgi:hypothetical protein